MKFWKLLIKKILTGNFITRLRNSINVRPIHLSIENFNFVSISDGFAWRTDKSFVTKFKFTNIFNLFYKLDDSWVEIHFFSKENKLLKIIDLSNLELSNEIIIDKNFLNGIEDYGTFYIFHYTNKKIDYINVISNRCYLGYSYNKNIYSFVHGNILSKYTKISKNNEFKTDIVKTSFLMNNNYKIQKYFDGFDKNELLFSNPTSHEIKFKIDDKIYELKEGNSKLIDITNKNIITIKSNCNFLRPTIFSYKNDYLDVHHS